MNVRRVVCLTLAGLTLGVSAVQMQAQPAQMHQRPPMERAFGILGTKGQWWNNPRIVDTLKLTDVQRKAMDDILFAYRGKLIDLRAALAKTELDMEPLVNADQPNEAKILAQIDRVAQARAELEKANARFLLALRAKLTPDQWKQVQDMRHPGMRREGWGPRDRRNGPKGPGNMMQQGPPPPGAPPSAAPAAGPQSMLDFLPMLDSDELLQMQG